MRSIKDKAITLDWSSGSVAGANWRERAGLALLKLAAVATQSPERPGFSKLASGITTFFPSDKFVRVKFPDGTQYQFPYGDGYWSVLCAPGFTYEGEIDGFVKRCAREGICYAFIDCGANFGYWSCRVSSEEDGAQKVIAIEASSESYGHTMRNRALNDNRFEAHHRAISKDHGKAVYLDGSDKHEQRSISDTDDGSSRSERVMSLALEKLEMIDPTQEKLVVKLDVEGVEVPALEGARSWLEKDTLVIFEDHGSDKEHLTAAAMMEQFGLRVFDGSKNGSFVEITDIRQMDAIKYVHRKGYDFFATKSEAWLEFFLSDPK